MLSAAATTLSAWQATMVAALAHSCLLYTSVLVVVLHSSTQGDLDVLVGVHHLGGVAVHGVPCLLYTSRCV